MNFSIILAHPNEASFNHAIAHICQQRLKELGHNVILHDLYAEKFDPLLPSNEISRNGIVDELVQKHCDEITQCDGIIIVHPNWWGQPPAILTGWIDRVIRPGVAYRFLEGDSGEGVPVGLLKAKNAIVFNTSDTSEERENSIFLDPLETIWKNCVFGLCGILNVERKIFRIVVTSTPEERKRWLEEVKTTINNHF
ncbi:MAG TPA: NAD(P)H-dependent oxidoreductase [Prolixibacteraceae bacterium]|nr:NAD(P)H-dependent oxidoreductase [Prolixibacteraceae bacterium]